MISVRRRIERYAEVPAEWGRPGRPRRHTAAGLVTAASARLTRAALAAGALPAGGWRRPGADADRRPTAPRSAP